MWNGNRDELDILFLHELNSQYLSIKFTLKIGGSSLNFLDLTINIESQRHEFSILHGKPTATDMTIHGTFSHTPAHKDAAYSCMTYRLVSVPLSKFSYDKEINSGAAIPSLMHIDLSFYLPYKTKPTNGT